MPVYKIDFKPHPDEIGLINSRDKKQRHLGNLNSEEKKEYLKQLKSHLYMFHGLETALMSERASNMFELEFVHRAMHEAKQFRRVHTHKWMTYPYLKTKLDEDKSPETIANTAINQFREQIAIAEAREKGRDD